MQIDRDIAIEDKLELSVIYFIAISLYLRIELSISISIQEKLCSYRLTKLTKNFDKNYL